MILAVRIPYFTAACMRRVYNIPPDAPIAVASRSHLVATCKGAAEAGLRIGLTVRQAKAILPAAAVIDLDKTVQDQMLAELLDSLSAFTPLSEHQSDTLYRGRARLKLIPDEAQAAILYADFERLRLADVQKLAKQMGETVESLFGIQPGIGIAAGKFPAYVAACAGTPGEPEIVAPGAEADYLKIMPITRLPLDEEMYRRLVTLGLVTIGQIAALPQEALIMQFGAHGFLLHRLAHGRDNRPVVPYQVSPTAKVSRDCDTPIANSQMLEALLRSMAVELSSQLQASGQMGRTLILTARFADKSVSERQITLRQPLSDAAHLAPKLLLLLTRMLPITSGVTALHVTFHDLMPLAGEQLDLFVHQAAQRDKLTRTLNVLSTRYKPQQFLWIRPLDPTARRIEQRYRLHPADAA